MAALARFIPLSEAAHRLHVSVKETRAMIASGKIQAGVLPDGAMVVSEDTLPKRKEDLPEYKQHVHLRGVGIGINEAAKKYSLNFSTLRRWSQSGYIARLGSEKNKILINEQDVAYCTEIYRRFGGQGKRLFNPDGTPYISESIVARNNGKVRIDVRVGDLVYAYKFLDKKKLETTGEIVEIKYENARRRKALVNGQWFAIRNDERNGIQIIKRASLAY